MLKATQAIASMLPWSLPWCPWHARVEIDNFLIGCPLPRSKCLGALALLKTKHITCRSDCAYKRNFLFKTAVSKETKAIASMLPGHCLSALKMLQWKLTIYFPHRVPFFKQKMHWFPCPFKTKAYRPECVFMRKLLPGENHESLKVWVLTINLRPA